MSTMLILGACSDIARAAALAFADEGWDICLAGRDMTALQRHATDITIRTGRTVTTAFFDALQPGSHEAFWAEQADSVQALLCAVGLLGDQQAARHDPSLAQCILATNFSGLVPILSMAADTFKQRQQGVMIVVSSVAGERGRASNYIYGSAKAGLTAFLSGLRQRLYRSNVHVLTVLPGFVATRMTEGMNLPQRLTATPAQVAADIVNAVRKKKYVVYSRYFWRFIMAVIKIIPEKVFVKLSRHSN